MLLPVFFLLPVVFSIYFDEAKDPYFDKFLSLQEIESEIQKLTDPSYPAAADFYFEVSKSELKTSQGKFLNFYFLVGRVLYKILM